MEIALLGFVAKTANVSLSAFLGGRSHESTPVLTMLGMGSTDLMAGRAAQLVKQGYEF